MNSMDVASAGESILKLYASESIATDEKLVKEK